MNLPEDIFLKLILAVIIGGSIGAEREYHTKSAGFRTLTLICIGATIFTIFSQILGDPGNRDRVASNIATGIGFVGAGVIFKGDFGVNGITTAAMIWVTASLGMAIGAGYELVSGIACLMILVMLFIFSKLEGWIDRINQSRNYKIVCEYNNETLHKYEECFRQYNLKFKRSREMKSGDIITGEWLARGTEKNHLQFINEIINNPSVKQFEY
jgi:putative Mg2+ transporter-C (MgtC) family protein